MPDVSFKLETPDIKPISLYTLPSIKDKSVQRQMLDLPEIVVVEKPDGKPITLSVINAEDDSQKRIEVVTRPHRGLSKVQLEMATTMIRQDAHISMVFTTIPMRQYYLHCVFYGSGFSEKEDAYSSQNFSIIALEHTGRVQEYEAYKHLIEQSMLDVHEIPVQYRGRPNMTMIERASVVSAMSFDGNGYGAYIIGMPIYYPGTDALMLFKTD